jgi:hypothetical protein
MPDVIQVTGTAFCSHCRREFPDVTIVCQWGMVPGPDYIVGDPVEWLACDGAVVEPYSIRADADGTWRWNSGDPRDENVLVIDMPSFGTGTVGTCPDCGANHAALAAETIAGHFSAILFLTDDAYHQAFGNPPAIADIAILNPNGTYQPRPDLYDPTLDTSFVVKPR